MKKKILSLLIGCLFVGINVYAAGDLQVNGGLGIGNTPPTNYKADLLTTNTRGMKVTATMNQNGAVTADSIHGMTLKSEVTGSASGFGSGINLITNVSSTATNVGGAYGGAFAVSLSSSAAGTTTVAETDSGVFGTSLNPGNHNYNVTQGVGFNLSLSDNRSSGSGSLHFDNFKNINIKNAANTYGALSVNSLSGLWIEKQTLGGTTNYGIVLNGDGAGADIVFGPAQQARIYSSAGRLYAADSAGNQTIISPHDPETGEWVFYSKNVKTGKTVRVDMEKLVKAVEKLTGETFMVETLIQE